MKDILLLLMTVLLSQAAWASPTVIDLSRSHSINDLERSGLVMQELPGGSLGRYLVFENQEVAILLPGGRSIQQWVELGTINANNGLITNLKIQGGVMPLEQSFQVAEAFLQNFNLPTTALRKWYDQNLGREYINDSFGSTTGWGFYPRVDLAISFSINKLYPTVVRCEMEWGQREQRDWNEERVWRELPPPTVAVISLNPPSGLRYQRRDAHKDALEAQKRFEQELAAKGQPSKPVVPPISTLPPTPPKSSPVVQTELPKSSLWPWIIGVILLLTVAGGALTKFLRK